MRVAAGIDIGGTSIKMGIVDSRGRCSSVLQFPTNQFNNATDFVSEALVKIREMTPANAKLEGIGIGAPNANYYHGTIEFAPNLPWKGIVPLVKMIQKESGLPCVITNDANAAAIGEMNFGAAKTLNDFIFITLGTGLGSGIVANRKIIYGHDGMAAELGHVIIEKNGRQCGCGRKGCLETYASVTGLKRTITGWLRQGKKSVLTDRNDFQPDEIFDAAEKGDLLAREAFEFTGEMLGLALANSVAYTSPKAIFLFGGLTNAKQWLFEPTQRHFENNLMSIYKNKIKILSSGLKENQAPILGAASLILNAE